MAPIISDSSGVVNVEFVGGTRHFRPNQAQILVAGTMAGSSLIIGLLTSGARREVYAFYHSVPVPKDF
jgi:hypothetical protein